MRQWARSRNQLSDSAQSHGRLQPVHARDRSQRHERRQGRRHVALALCPHRPAHLVGVGDAGRTGSDGVSSGQKSEVRGQRLGVRGQKSEKTKLAPVATWQLRFAGQLVRRHRRFDSTYCVPRRCGWHRHSHKVTRLTNSADFPRCFSRPGFRCKSLLIHRLRPKTRQIGRMNDGELAFLAFSRPFRRLQPASRWPLTSIAAQGPSPAPPDEVST